MDACSCPGLVSKPPPSRAARRDAVSKPSPSRTAPSSCPIEISPERTARQNFISIAEPSRAARSRGGIGWTRESCRTRRFHFDRTPESCRTKPAWYPVDAPVVPHQKVSFRYDTRVVRHKMRVVSERSSSHTAPRNSHFDTTSGRTTRDEGRIGRPPGLPHHQFWYRKDQRSYHTRERPIGATVTRIGAARKPYRTCGRWIEPCYRLDRMPSRDTTAAAAKMQDDIHRRFTPADRLRMAMEMSEFARSLSKAGLRTRRPDLTDAELDTEMMNVMYGFRPRQK
jgi:hypothetical protein